MWNCTRSFSPAGPVIGPFLQPQKRDFSYNMSNLSVVPKKLFSNQNFVSNHYPKVQNHFNSTSYSPYHTCHNSGDTIELIKVKSSENSSQNNIDIIQENPPEIPIEKITIQNNQMCSTRKRCKKNRRNRKKVTNKSSKQNKSRRQISDMMEVDIEPDVSRDNTDYSMSSNFPSASPTCISVADFILDIPAKTSKSDDDVFTFISISPSISNRPYTRERQISICESEDSFIVFDSGTDEELKFSDSEDDTELDSEDTDDGDDDEVDGGSDSEIDDDCDSSFSVVPCKRVRFADNEDLCEIHQMVQWSFAYRNARKGPWEEYARDRERFNKRINETERILAPVFDSRHRENVYKARFEDTIG
ncbi:uncharacterized protein PPP1R15 isoform X1 [Diabrotica undecimpunctata]|uniref:uncharacterized protein PPP1R15 isoform X1 n=1 Tax=Diabrotica undecimpunctata TaxID=50387 RepID=UPI003B642952